ncbi:amidohydrolase family protein [Zhaonella formicivorans]|uniref:amidohydrolase family protein n=1 Tax=Zhaonella formicivorans TaxID=2528593 RepID=UPI0010DEA301|nr:amidohydrolase family protein [Zhaonella formicivorans]
MLDLIIRQAKLPDRSELVDIAIQGGNISEVKPCINAEAAQVIEANGRLVSPGFVDAHTHLEKVLTLEGTEVCTLEEAIMTFKSRYSRITKDDIKNRAKKVVEMAVQNGTTAIRTHISVDDKIGLMAIEALGELKKEVAHLVDLQIVAMATIEGQALDETNLKLLEQAPLHGASLYGGAPTLCENSKGMVDSIFALAKQNNLLIDLHVDETDEPTVATLEYVAEKTMREGMEGKVTAGHCCSLSAVSDEIAARVIAKVRDAGMHIITLPSCNLYLMGRSDKQPIRRGVTRVRELLTAGVNVAYASDNIRDPFRPFGNADMLEEALITAQVLQMGTTSELNKVFEMGTYNPAKALRLERYGIEAGCKADLVIFDAASPSEAIVTQATKAFVIKNGKILVQTKKEVLAHF